MTDGVGVLRSAQSMGHALAALDLFGPGEPSTGGWEMANLLFVARALTMAAFAREETRGSHWREDFPAPSERWLVRLQTRVVDGEMTMEETAL
jgi:L-aspartate oxidase